MGNDKTYVYGSSNGSQYDEIDVFNDGHGLTGREITKRTHWDPRIEVLPYPGHGQVQIGIVPASDRSTEEQGLWDSDDGQFMQLSRDGLNRLIEALQEAGAATFGRDRW